MIALIKKDTTVVSSAPAGIITPDKLLCKPTQRFVIQPGVWTSIGTYSGAGVITKYWIAIYGGRTDASQAVAGGEVSNCRMRVRVDGESTASVFGAGGATMREWYCLPELSATTGIRYENDFMNVSANSAANFGAMLVMPTPFSNGAVVEFFNPLGGAIEVWSMMEVNVGFSAFPYDPNYRLSASVNLNSSIQPAAEHVMLNTTKDTILAAYFKWIDGSGISKPWSFEGDDRMYYNGSSMAEWRSSGTEDNQDTSYTWEFLAPSARRNYKGTTFFQIVGSGGAQGALYCRYVPDRVPRGASGLKLTWANGDPDYQAPDGNHLPPGPVSNRATVFAYIKTATGSTPPPAGTGGTPTQLDPTVLAAKGRDGVAILSWTPVVNATTYRVETSTDSTFATGVTLVYSGSGQTATASGLTNGTMSYFRIKVSATGYTDSPYSNTSATPEAYNTNGLRMKLTAGNGVVTDAGGLVSNWNDAAGNANFTSSSGPPSFRPTFVASDAAANNQPVLHFAGGQQMQATSTIAALDTFTLYAVVKASGQQHLLGNQISSQDPTRWWFAQNNAFEDGSVAPVAPLLWGGLDNVYKIIRFEVSPTLIRVFENGQAVQAKNAPHNIVADNIGLLTMGAKVTNSTVSAPGNFLLGTLLLYDNVRSATQAGYDEDALRATYGISY
ncbi:DUF2961 domain-containing protein [Hymenobacter sp. PAMC 26628]|uniref:DUF2961 domain-containing protein n=1 Tax=Hymenobacter sp. PAMC 26628 TaxID=1484118 RepID=UPI0007701AC7|nr:hypothetical protein [Hymenobacter sp. PAMC 26628]AMJ65033.1 hypothetical protein AXW84_06030 [Hymenobacter sp. PAMC 26628]